MKRLLLTVLLLLASSAWATPIEEQFLTIGGSRLVLGMDRSKVLEIIKRNNSIRCIGIDSNQIPTACDLIISRDDKSDADILGSVYFDKVGRIKRVMKNYSQKDWDGDPAKIISFLYEVLRQYSLNGETFVSSLSEVREPGWISKSIFFRSGRKLITVGYGEGGLAGVSYKPFTTMHERLE